MRGLLWKCFLKTFSKLITEKLVLSWPADDRELASFLLATDDRTQFWIKEKLGSINWAIVTFGLPPVKIERRGPFFFWKARAFILGLALSSHESRWGRRPPPLPTYVKLKARVLPTARVNCYRSLVPFRPEDHAAATRELATFKRFNENTFILSNCR